MRSGWKKGKTNLYSIWKNSDDSLVILDGSAQQCADRLGVTLNSFYRIVCGASCKGTYTIQKISSDKAKREGAS